jgi:hypothetical protein
MSDVVQMWRCTSCGKWSHAVRRPKKHTRFISEADQPYDYEPTETIISYEPGMSDYISGESTAGGWMVECGPFEEWHAERVS